MLKERFGSIPAKGSLSFGRRRMQSSEVGQLGLVETGGFDLTLARGRISGSGSLRLTRRWQESHALDAREGEAWTIETTLMMRSSVRMSEIQSSRGPQYRDRGNNLCLEARLEQPSTSGPRSCCFI